MRCLERNSNCKVNLLLNILGKRSDGFHELETIMHPVALFDTLQFECASGQRVELSCSNPALSADSSNLVWRAATTFLDAAAIQDGVRIHLEKRIPLAAGLGGGSANAAVTLLALNEFFGSPLGPKQLESLAAGLGSDVPFFLQPFPALATGRGEQIAALGPLPALQGAFILLIHPGFGVSTRWAYEALATFPDALQGSKGRAQVLLSALRHCRLEEAGKLFYNALEAPVLRKFPVLQLYQEFLRENGAAATLMSGSGSTTFALVERQSAAQTLQEAFQARFGTQAWTAIARVDGRRSCDG